MKPVSDKDVYWITEHAQYECLMSPRRMEIIDLLANVGVRSVREIARLLGAKPSSLYHHMDLLLEVGLVEVSDTRVINRRREKLYKTPGSTLRYGLDFSDPLAFSIYSRIGDMQARQSARDLRRGIDADDVVTEGPAKNIWIFRLVGAPDAATMEQINRHLQEIARLFWGSAGQDNPLVVMSAIVAPVPRPEKGDS